jgi:hypothetical protein
MNERIKKLYEQAHIERHQEYFSSVVDPTITSISVTRHFNPDLFAELIVKECANTVEYYYSRNETVTPRQILQHFGIKE